MGNKHPLYLIIIIIIVVIVILALALGLGLGLGLRNRGGDDCQAGVFVYFSSPAVILQGYTIPGSYYARSNPLIQDCSYNLC